MINLRSDYTSALQKLSRGALLGPCDGVEVHQIPSIPNTYGTVPGLTAMAASSSGEVIAVGDKSGAIRRWAPPVQATALLCTCGTPKERARATHSTGQYERKRPLPSTMKVDGDSRSANFGNQLERAALNAAAPSFLEGGQESHFYQASI